MTASTEMLSTSTIVDKEEFVSKYLRRLKLNPNEFIDKPTIENLRKIQEAHLNYIPFENLSQHGCSYPATVTDIQQVAVKILDKHRGGFCLELNGLLAELLIQLGYTVCRVPSYVYVENKMFRDVVSHVILIVSCTDTSQDSLWMVDVGFGEPSIHPLRYGDESFGELQSTPDGMQSKICKMNDGTDDVILYWWHAPLTSWVPRLKWNYTASMLKKNGPPLSSFANALASVTEEASIFSQKMICCRLTREQKFTVAGNRYKVTGSPRFIVNTGTDHMNGHSNGDTTPSSSSSQTVPVVLHQIQSEDELRSILQETFGIPIEATDGITLVKSIAADPMIWSNQ